MSKKMLIDATHAEETRVVIVDNGKLEELDVDTSTKKQIKGNIYLAKVVRVEPSLQAAFVDYGGNRHGFLAFAEIHPDYYQIPAADKEALKAQMAAKERDDDEDAPKEKARKNAKPARVEKDEVKTEAPAPEATKEGEAPVEGKAETEVKAEAEEKEETPVKEKAEVEVVSESETEDVVRRPNFFKKYKIQDVIRHGQVMLIQVVKEERGNKGAALTTYLSLAGRYSVLMPNNGKGGGVSRKISNAKERKEMRAIVEKLPIPQGMSVIVRTAGQGKTKAEIKRDYDYLIKTWMNIRETTLESMAPKLIHEEGDIIKRSLRDVFTPDIEEILIEGEQTFKDVKEFVKMLIPGQVKKVKQYKGGLPLFQEMRVEEQLEAIHNNVVQLRSGGYIVIDQTEALVSIDVNSGRATRERDIEETALKTNLETCDEVARQLKLRDLAGLIVIDFIDMDEGRNNAAVERRLKEALKKDRARIQVGKISGFGLMEMSRQRLHSSLLEGSYKRCACCDGKGLVRSVESCAMRSIHILEDAAFRNEGNAIVLTVPVDVAFYLLNQKRLDISAIETKYKVTIQVVGDSGIEKQSDYRLERVRDGGERQEIRPQQQQNNQRRDRDQQQNNGRRDRDQNNQRGRQDQRRDQQQVPKTETVEQASGDGEKIDGGQSQNQGQNQGQGESRNQRRNRRRRDKWKNRDGQGQNQGQQGGQQKTHEASNAPEKLMSEGEEKFKIVEQEPLVMYDSHKGSDKPKAEPKKAEQPKDDAPKAESKGMQASDLDSVLPSGPKKGGWWSKLVK